MSRIVKKNNLWKYYVKLPNFQAQCMFCENKYCYICLTNFKIHVIRYHKKTFKYEEKIKLIQGPWMYFKFLDKLYSQCIICHAKVLSTSESVENHSSLHSEEQRKSHACHNWLWKYFTKKDDFMIKCNICHKELLISASVYLDFHIKMQHLDELKNIQETHETVDSLMSLNITKKNLWKYYIKLSNFKAQCIFCEHEHCYLSLSRFRKHVAVRHSTIFKYEEERKLKKSWMNFKFLNKLYSQCIICDASVLSTSESVENHLSSHSEKQEQNAPCSWPQKYITKRDDFVIECDICHNNVTLSVSYNLNIHMKTHLNKLKNMQGIHDIIDSSKRVLSLERDTISVVTKNHLWKYYVKLPNFEAQCMFCEKKYYYIYCSNFQMHVTMCHNRIWKYEKKRRLMKWPWMYFKYFNELNSQCVICDANVPSIYESAENHLRSHSGEQLKNHIFCNWPSKYWTQTDDFAVKCNICQKEDLTLSLSKSINFHTKKAHSDKLKNTQETQNTVDSSEHVSSARMDTMLMPLKDCYVLLTKCPPYNLYI